MYATVLGVLSGTHDLGISVPHDLSVVGFDNIAMASEIIRL